MNDASSIVNTLWSCCNVRRDDDRGALAQIEATLVDLTEAAV